MTNCQRLTAPRKNSESPDHRARCRWRSLPIRRGATKGGQARWDRLPSLEIVMPIRGRAGSGDTRSLPAASADCTGGLPGRRADEVPRARQRAAADGAFEPPILDDVCRGALRATPEDHFSAEAAGVRNVRGVERRLHRWPRLRLRTKTG